MGHAFDDLICGYCRAPIVDHGESTLKICVHRLTSERRDLAEKVLAAINGERLHDNLDNDGDTGYMQAIEDVTTAVRRVFTESGVAVEREG